MPSRGGGFRGSVHTGGSSFSFGGGGVSRRHRHRHHHHRHHDHYHRHYGHGYGWSWYGPRFISPFGAYESNACAGFCCFAMCIMVILIIVGAIVGFGSTNTAPDIVLAPGQTLPFPINRGTIKGADYESVTFSTTEYGLKVRMYPQVIQGQMLNVNFTTTHRLISSKFEFDGFTLPPGSSMNVDWNCDKDVDFFAFKGYSDFKQFKDGKDYTWNYHTTGTHNSYSYIPDSSDIYQYYAVYFNDPVIYRSQMTVHASYSGSVRNYRGSGTMLRDCPVGKYCHLMMNEFENVQFLVENTGSQTMEVKFQENSRPKDWGKFLLYGAVGLLVVMCFINTCKSKKRRSNETTEVAPLNPAAPQIIQQPTVQTTYVPQPQPVMAPTTTYAAQPQVAAYQPIAPVYQ
ncbi:hypothetical protein PCE1_002643 [Barthelona sp. PCE]